MTEDELVVAAEAVPEVEPGPESAGAPFVPPLAEVEFEPAAESRCPCPRPSRWRRQKSSEPAVEAAVEEVDAFVVEDAGVEPSPTLLMTSPDEIAEPEREFSAIEFGETVALVQELPAPPPPPSPEVPEPVVALPEPPPLAAPEPPPVVVPPAPPLPPTPPPAPPLAPWRDRSSPWPTPAARRDGSLRHAVPPPRHAPPPAEAEAEVEPDETEAPAESQAGGKRSLVLAAAGFGGVLVLAGLGWLASAIPGRFSRRPETDPPRSRRPPPRRRPAGSHPPGRDARPPSPRDPGADARPRR